MKSLATAVGDYLRLRRALGFKLRETAASLRDFAAYLKRHGAARITTDHALQWAMQPVHAQPVQWARRLSRVRLFAEYCRAFDPGTEIPPRGILPYRYRRTAPYLYRDAEVRRLLTAARTLPSPTGLRGWTYATLFALLAVTGMRITEILALDAVDVDLAHALLTVRSTKFGKSRLVPLHGSTTRALQDYIRRRDHIHRTRRTDSFFVSESGRRLSYTAVRLTFVGLSQQIGLRARAAHRGPRLHDFRHRFAVRTILRWYRRGVAIDPRMPVLSAYLGHAHVTDTYWYLSAVPELLRLAAARLDHPLDKEGV